MFYEEIMIFDEIRGHFAIVKNRDSKGPLRKKAIKFKVEMLHTLTFLKICLI